MKNHYSFGFYGLLAAFAILVCAIFYSTLTDGRPESTDKAFSVINSVSALIQAIAAVLLAGLAFKGWNSWKLQIIHGKALGVIWDANVALREVEAALNVLEARWIRSYAEGSDQSTELGETGLAGKALRSFRDQCVLLDKVVVKNDWEWQNYSNDLSARIRELVLEQAKEKYVASDCRKPTSTRGLGQIFNSKTDETVAEKRGAIYAATDAIARRLSALEAKYI